MKGFDNLTHEESKQMLEWLMYRIKSDQRRALAASLPQAYNHWCGDAIVKVVSVNDPEHVWS